MNRPDQRLFDADVAGAEFRIGLMNGWWGLADGESLPAELKWPHALLWIAAPSRENAPSRYHLRLDLAGYRAASPTGAFWDVENQVRLPLEKWPKGKVGTRFAKVFRTDWENGVAFYHPYDRFAAGSHGEWPKAQPHLVWTGNHTIVDYLAEFHTLLQCGDYLGV